MDFFSDKISQRLGGKDFGGECSGYKFEMIKRAKAKVLVDNPERALIDMGVGEPDWAADAGVTSILAAEAPLLCNRWYADNGIAEFQQAAKFYMQSVYRVDNLDSERNIIHGIGSKPILAMLALCLINAGDVLLTTVPGYPVMSTYAGYLGGEVYSLPLFESNNFFPDFKRIPVDVLRRAKAIYLNYPNNPTGQTATANFFKEVVNFAYKNDIVVVHDAAYAAVTFDGCEPLSFLTIDGAMDVGLEVHSLSKAFNMTGWRLAFVAGSEKLVKAYGAVKDNTDSGQFRAIQKAGVFALQHTEITAKTCEKYSRRFDLLIDALRHIGFDAHKPQGTFYCYTKAPIGAGDVLFSTAAQASEYLINHASISTVPWDEAGAYLRFSVTFEADDVKKEKAIVSELERRLEALNLRFD